MNIRQSRTRTIHLLLCCAMSLAVTACESRHGMESANADAEPRFGVMVMAHGGSDEWNAQVAKAVAPLREQYPLELALGMADAGSMEAAVRKLESRGVTHVGVVRVFISGESWHDRTLQILGLREGAPPRTGGDQQRFPAAAAQMPMGMSMPMGFWKIDTGLAFHVSVEGLADAPEVDEILTSRIGHLSVAPEKEVVAVIAHGPGDDGENRRWLDKITERTQNASEQLGLREIRVFTLREDWPEQRVYAEQEIRSYIEQANSRGLTPIVAPFRIHGFGPYGRVLGELDYRADGLGLLPHPNVTAWISRQAKLLESEALQPYRR